MISFKLPKCLVSYYLDTVATIVTLGVSQYSNPGLTGSPQPRRGELQSPNRTITPAGATLPCKAWSFIEGNTPRHHVCEYNHVFPH
jgi:hypothetical protein